MATQTDPSLTHYIAAAHAYPRLSGEEELALTTRWLEHKDETAREELVRANLRYVLAIAFKYHRYGLGMSELVAEGNFGLVHALQKFDASRGTRFVTYAAYWIRAYILNHIIRSWSMVGGGSGALRSKMFFKLRRERVRIANLVGDGEQADELLAQALDVPKSKIASLVRSLDARDVSLDASAFGDSTTTLGETLTANEVNQEEGLVDSEIGTYARAAIATALTGLDNRERYIVENRLMADNEDEMSLADIGRTLGVSRERARQLEARAKKKLKTRITELSRGNGWLDVHDAA
ncbi:MAG TPA: sigma-70 family RNA polymerase sigma factor [Polyangiaceae bacterium]|jgi:RNA polymerase sigma-32 factor|nr:sigma-70 family RNA polymerase sigma factor [Polyangiaceae bacterium]